MSHFKELLNLMSIRVFHTKSAAVLRKTGIGYMKAVFYILIFTLWPSDSKSSRLYEAGFYILFLRCGRGKDIINISTNIAVLLKMCLYLKMMCIHFMPRIE